MVTVRHASRSFATRNAKVAMKHARSLFRNKAFVNASNELENSPTIADKALSQREREFAFEQRSEEVHRKLE
ncbi:MAG: hypothetical protein WDZ59_14305 [Pirellulales bacterium]